MDEDKQAMLGKLISQLDRFYRQTGGDLHYIDRPLKDAVKKFGGPDGEKWLAEFKKFLRKEPCWVAMKTYLRQLFTGEDILIDETNGMETFQSAGFGHKVSKRGLF